MFWAVLGLMEGIADLFGILAVEEQAKDFHSRGQVAEGIGGAIEEVERHLGAMSGLSARCRAAT